MASTDDSRSDVSTGTVSSTGDSSVSDGRKHSVFDRLYTGTGAFNIVGKRKRWYLIFGVLVLVCIASIAIRWFNLGIDFDYRRASPTP